EKNGPCNKCGSYKDLEVDHINPEEKNMESRSIWTRREEIRDNELSKCQVLCRDCHIDKTKKENEERGVLFKKGSQNPASKIDKDDVIDIKKRLNTGEAQKSIAKDYPVSRQTISKIKHGVIWSHLCI